MRQKPPSTTRQEPGCARLLACTAPAGASDEGGGAAQAVTEGEKQLPLRPKSKISSSSPDKGSRGVWKTGTPQRRTAFVGRGEAKAQVEFSACGKWNIVTCASTKIGGWDKDGTTNPFFCDIIVSSKKGKGWICFGRTHIGIYTVLNKSFSLQKIHRS